MLTHRRTLSIEKDVASSAGVCRRLPRTRTSTKAPLIAWGDNGEGVLQIWMKRTVLIVGPLWSLTLMVFCYHSDEHGSGQLCRRPISMMSLCTGQLIDANMTCPGGVKWRN